MSGDPKLHNVNGAVAHGETNNTGYNNVGSGGYDGSGGLVSRFITPGGNPIDNSNIALPTYHRKFANPTPLGLLGYVNRLCVRFTC
jgi:hypothetical protein